MPMTPELIAYKARLLEIHREVCSDASLERPFTGAQQYSDFHRVVATLLWIIDNMDDLMGRSKVTANRFLSPTPVNVLVPIHLDAFWGPKEVYTPDEIRNNICSGLISIFILAYNKVKNDQSFLDIFCSRLSEYCIDARVRIAFDYALSLETNPLALKPTKKVSAIVTEISNALPEGSKDSFFLSIAQLVDGYWGSEIFDDRIPLPIFSLREWSESNIARKNAIYIQAVEEGLEYKVIDSKLKEAGTTIIPWAELPEVFQRNMRLIVEKKDDFLPQLLTITAKAGHTPELKKVRLNSDFYSQASEYICEATLDNKSADFIDAYFNCKNKELFARLLLKERGALSIILNEQSFWGLSEQVTRFEQLIEESKILFVLLQEVPLDPLFSLIFSKISITPKLINLLLLEPLEKRPETRSPFLGFLMCEGALLNAERLWEILKQTNKDGSTALMLATQNPENLGVLLEFLDRTIEIIGFPSLLEMLMKTNKYDSNVLILAAKNPKTLGMLLSFLEKHFEKIGLKILTQTYKDDFTALMLATKIPESFGVFLEFLDRTVEIIGFESLLKILLQTNKYDSNLLMIAANSPESLGMFLSFLEKHIEKLGSKNMLAMLKQTNWYDGFYSDERGVGTNVLGLVMDYPESSGMFLKFLDKNAELIGCQSSLRDILQTGLLNRYNSWRIQVIKEPEVLRIFLNFLHKNTESIGAETLHAILTHSRFLAIKNPETFKIVIDYLDNYTEIFGINTLQTLLSVNYPNTLFGERYDIDPINPETVRIFLEFLEKHAVYIGVETCRALLTRMDRDVGNVLMKLIDFPECLRIFIKFIQTNAEFIGGVDTFRMMLVATKQDGVNPLISSIYYNLESFKILAEFIKENAGILGVETLNTVFLKLAANGRHLTPLIIVAGEKEKLGVLLELFQVIEIDTLRAVLRSANSTVCRVMYNLEIQRMFLEFLGMRAESIGSETLSAVLCPYALLDVAKNYEALKMLLEFLDRYIKTIGIECVRTLLLSSDYNGIGVVDKVVKNPQTLEIFIAFLNKHAEIIGIETLRKLLGYDPNSSFNMLMRVAFNCPHKFMEVLNFIVSTPLLVDHEIMLTMFRQFKMFPRYSSKQIQNLWFNNYKIALQEFALLNTFTPDKVELIKKTINRDDLCDTFIQRTIASHAPKDYQNIIIALKKGLGDSPLGRLFATHNIIKFGNTTSEEKIQNQIALYEEKILSASFSSTAAHAKLTRPEKFLSFFEAPQADDAHDEAPQSDDALDNGAGVIELSAKKLVP